VNVDGWKLGRRSRHGRLKKKVGKREVKGERPEEKGVKEER